MRKRNQIAGAPTVMQKRGKKTDSLVLTEVERRPGSTVHEIADRLNWTNGRVDGSINRLVSQGKVRVQHTLRKGILLKKIYPVEHALKPRNVIHIPRNMIDEDLWKKTVEIYALSRTTIAIAPTKVEEWEKRAFRREQVLVQKTDDILEIRLSRSLSDFYQLENSEVSLSTTGNLALITVESTLLPVALPPTYPAEALYRYTRIMIVGQFEKIPSLSPIWVIDVNIVEGKGEAKNIPTPSEFFRHEVLEKAEKTHTFTSSSAPVEIPVVVK